MTPNPFIKILLIICSTSLIAAGNAAAEGSEQKPPPSKDVLVTISDIYVQRQYDQEADAFVIVSGIFPNGCYRWKGAEVLTQEPFTHDVISVARVSQDQCVMVLLPFSKAIYLGKLEAGIHTLKFINEEGVYLEVDLLVTK